MENASKPMVVTLAGIVMASRFTQFAKARCPMEVMPSGIVTLQPIKLIAIPIGMKSVKREGFGSGCALDAKMEWW